MRGSIQGGGTKLREREPNRVGRIFVRYSCGLSLCGVIAAGCAAQDASDTPSNGATSSTAGAAGSSAGAAHGGGGGAGGSINVAGSTATGGSSTAGTSGSPGVSGSGGIATAGSGGVAATAGAAGAAGAGGKGGAGGTAGAGGAGGGAGVSGAAGAGGKGGAGGASGAGGAGGSGGASGAGGAGGSGGASGASGAGGSGGASGTNCSVVTDCAVQSVCDAGKCRARGCNATNCAYDLTTFVIGTPVAASARGQAFVTWNATNLVVDFQIFDKTAQNDSALNWEDDSAEIYLDLNHARSGAYDADDFQINVPRDAGTLVGLGTNLNYGAIVVVRTENADGYELKVTVPWSALNGAGSQVGKTIGFDLALNDDRDGGTRETQIVLYGSANAYQDTKQFGDLTLTP